MIGSIFRVAGLEDVFVAGIKVEKDGFGAGLVLSSVLACFWFRAVYCILFLVVFADSAKLILGIGIFSKIVHYQRLLEGTTSRLVAGELDLRTMICSLLLLHTPENVFASSE